MFSPSFPIVSKLRLGERGGFREGRREQRTGDLEACLPENGISAVSEADMEQLLER